MHMVSHTGEMPYKVGQLVPGSRVGMWTPLPGVVLGTSPLKPAFLAHPVTLL